MAHVALWLKSASSHPFPKVASDLGPADFWASPSSGGRAQWALLSAYCLCVHNELTEFEAEPSEFALLKQCSPHGDLVALMLMCFYSERPKRGRKIGAARKVLKSVGNYFDIFLTIFDVFCPARKLSKSEEIIFDPFFFFWRGPFPPAPFAVRWFMALCDFWLAYVDFSWRCHKGLFLHCYSKNAAPRCGMVSRASRGGMK